MGRTLIAIGLLLLVVGVIVEFGGHFLPLAHLPGDIHITGRHGSFYCPIVTCIVVSVILNLLLRLFH